MNRPIIFLDVDGVLNGHEYDDEAKSCNIRRECVKRLNRIVGETGAKIVLSSAWRYMVHGGAMTLSGFGYMLRTHGLSGHGADLIIGLTRKDAEISDPSQIVEHQRAMQVLDWLGEFPGERPNYLVIDDDDDGFTHHGMPFLHTDGASGLTDADIPRAVAILRGEHP